MSGYVIGHASFPKRELAPALYIVATPIGNLSDITIRALETLSSCDLIACEDTRVTGKLLARFGIKNRMLAYHEHNAETAGRRVLDSLDEGKSVALVSDAGTPLVSDPGFRLVDQARTEGIEIVPIPGCSASLTALVASGLPADTWCFAGFLPAKRAARRSRLEELKPVPATLLVFESPKRLEDALVDMAAVLGEARQAAVCRELTKLYEEVVRGSLGDLSRHYRSAVVKGEVVIVIGPAEDEADEFDIDGILTELIATMPLSQAAAEAASLTGRPKRKLYQRALQLRAEIVAR